MWKPGADVGEVVGRRGGGRPAGRGDRHVDRAAAGRRGGGDRARGVTVMVAALEPKSTAVAPERLVPLMVTLVPPPVGPLVGLIEVTVGAGT